MSKSTKKNITAKRQCIKNAATSRCRKSLKRDSTSKNCKYFMNTSRCRKTFKSEFVKFTVLKKNYKISSTVLKWLTALKTSNKIPSNFEKHPEELNDLLKGLKIKGEKDMNDKVIKELLGMSRHAAIDDHSEIGDIIQLKHVKIVLKMNRDISYAVNGKYTE